MTERDRITRGRMGRVDRLDGELRETVHRMLRAGRTQKEILGVLNAALGERGEEPIGAASLNRYVNRPAIRALAERARAACEMGAAIARSADEGGGAELDRGLVQAGQTLAMEALPAIPWDELEPEDRVKLIANFGLAVRRFASSAAVADARGRAIRADAAEAAVKEARRQGLSAEGAAKIRAQIEGAA